MVYRLLHLKIPPPICHCVWFHFLDIEAQIILHLLKFWSRHDSLKIEMSIHLWKLRYLTSKVVHISKINDLCSTLNSKKMLQNLLCFNKKKTHVVFFVFHFEHFWVFGLCWHRPGHSLVHRFSYVKYNKF